MRPAWITPQTAPTGFVEFCLIVPDGAAYLGMLRAFLIDASDPDNWEQVGGITACDAAALAETILASFEGRNPC